MSHTYTHLFVHRAPLTLHLVDGVMLLILAGEVESQCRATQAGTGGNERKTDRENRQEEMGESGGEWWRMEESGARTAGAETDGTGVSVGLCTRTANFGVFVLLHLFCPGLTLVAK